MLRNLVEALSILVAMWIFVYLAAGIIYVLVSRRDIKILWDRDHRPFKSNQLWLLKTVMVVTWIKINWPRDVWILSKTPKSTNGTQGSTTTFFSDASPTWLRYTREAGLVLEPPPAGTREADLFHRDYEPQGRPPSGYLEGRRTMVGDGGIPVRTMWRIPYYGMSDPTLPDGVLASLASEEDAGATTNPPPNDIEVGQVGGGPSGNDGDGVSSKALSPKKKLSQSWSDFGCHS